MAKQKQKQKPQTLAQALKQAIEDGPKSRYQISKESGVPEGTLSRFVNLDTDMPFAPCVPALASHKRQAVVASPLLIWQSLQRDRHRLIRLLRTTSSFQRSTASPPASFAISRSSWG